MSFELESTWYPEAAMDPDSVHIRWHGEVTLVLPADPVLLTEAAGHESNRSTFQKYVIWLPYPVYSSSGPSDMCRAWAVLSRTVSLPIHVEMISLYVHCLELTH